MQRSAAAPPCYVCWCVPGSDSSSPLLRRIAQVPGARNRSMEYLVSSVVKPTAVTCGRSSHASMEPLTAATALAGWPLS